MKTANVITDMIKQCVLYTQVRENMAVEPLLKHCLSCCMFRADQFRLKSGFKNNTFVDKESDVL